MKNKVLIETSARHAHVTEETFKILFGEDKQLTPKNDLSQPGQFAAEERVTVVGPRNKIERVIILGPFRKADQVEVSATDARTLGVEAVIRESGEIKGSPGCKLVGPKGEVELKEGVIVAKRHIHATPEDAKALGLNDRDVVSVDVNNGVRSITYKDVTVRVREDFALAMHIDTDESNAGAIGRDTYGTIIK